MIGKAVAMLAWLAASYAILLSGVVSGGLALLVAVSLGLAMAGVGFNVMHDGNHGSGSSSSMVNRVLGLTLDLIGGSSYIWRFKHNAYHHNYANIAGLDTDIDGEPFLRLAPGQRRRRFHRFQHLYAWLLYGALALKWWIFDDFRDLATGRIGDHPFPRPRGGALAGLVGGKLLFFGWAFVVPQLLHPGWQALALGVVAAVTTGIVLSSVFQLAHCVADAEFHAVTTAGGVMAGDWAAHQVSTTVDFARESRLLAWYLGGLNFQIEHHLFPGICHLHYPEIAGIVEETCREFGVGYRAHPTLGAAVASSVRWLRHLGRPAR